MNTTIMNKVSLLILVIFGFIGCQDNDNLDDVIDQKDDYNFTYLLLHKNDLNDTIYRQEYSIQEGLVLSERYTNYNNPQYNHLSTFEYDNDGRILKEIREGEIFKHVTWDGNNAKVFNFNKKLEGEFNFNSSLELKSYNRNGQIFLNYDGSGNIISKSTNEGVFVEYLDYDYSYIYPLYLINSIAILRLYYKPHFKNVFKTEKVYPFEGDDYLGQLAFYDYFWTLNTDGLIETITDEKSRIYLQKFEYK